ncbi:GNAT family N-acetyltransferase [Amycolatopsis sp. YIM 10]|uniref:GNAT family N-acetyltransferase n=1 Tax=Amycolatopsis sp. YIM 10 TaxID=2653857 RepID=UPI00128FF8B7|nr:GNAT family N-acetyltransferase [Amycolatopsis sp. YIM 10]QFU93779.1 Acetyltransferase (GNAT) family protein [Amycolatopsis sp. YIM 10]
MEIREATVAELATLPALESASDSIFAELGFPPLPPPGSPDELAAARLVLVAGSPPAGFARVEVVDGNAHLEQLAVHPAHFRQGIGTSLVRAVLTWARTAGFPAVTLCTFADIPWNGPFYRKLGFTEVADPGPGLRELRAHEQALGLDDLGARTVLRHPLTAS